MYNQHPLPPVIISACLLGLPTRYNGETLCGFSLPARFKGRALVPFCPEQFGGLPTPRPSQEFLGGSGIDVLEGRARLVNTDGVDTTDNFLKGASTACRIAELIGAKEALLKDGSPSCGVTRVTVDGQETSGLGVTAAALKKLGIELYPCE